MNGTQANAAAAIIVAAYLLAANLRIGGKQRMEKLVSLLADEGGFFKWGIAAALLWWLSTRKEIGEIGAGLIALVVLTLAIKVANDPSILSGIEKAWGALPEPATKKI